MALKSLSILGLRGFETKQKLEFSQPDGQAGAGITYVLGANNSGKSTITEAIGLIGLQNRSASEGKRNKAAGDAIEIELTYTTGQTAAAKSVEKGSANIALSGEQGVPTSDRILIVPSRRPIQPILSQGTWQRSDMVENTKGVPAVRGGMINTQYRFFTHSKDLRIKAKFDQTLEKSSVVRSFDN